MAPESVTSELLSKEELLWVGQADASVVFGPYEVLLIPLSLVWAAVAFYWEASALGWTGAGGDVSAYMPWIGIPLVLLALYLLVGRFFYRAWKRRGTWYAVSNLRAMVVEEGVQRRVTSVFLKTVPMVTKRGGPRGTGCLLFGPITFTGAAMMNSGLGLFARSASSGLVAFFDVPEVGRVEALVDERRKAGA